MKKEINYASLEEAVTLAKEGNTVAVNYVFEKCNALLKNVVFKTTKNMWSPLHMEPDDLLQEVGGLALMESIHEFDASKGASFTTFLFGKARGRISHLCESEAMYQHGNIPQALVRAAFKIKAECDKANDGDFAIGGKEWLETANRLYGNNPKAMAKLRAVGSRWGVCRLDENVDDGEGNSVPRGALIASPAPTPEEAVVGATDDLSEALQSALFGLTEKERNTFLLYTGKQLTFSEIGDLYGIQAATAQQTYARAVTKLRKELGVKAE